MRSEWPSLSLRDAGVSLIDCEHRTPPPAEGGYPYIAIPQIKEGRLDLGDVRYITREHFVEWTRKARPKPHDVILSRRCNPGETAVVSSGLECALGQNLVLLRADGTKVWPPFLRWLVRGPEWWEQIGNFINAGAVFDSLKCADIPNFRLATPPLAQQRVIAEILGSLDDKIELNRRINETLEGMARTIFKSWFVNFDPVRAKAACRPPAGMDADTAALFPNRLQDSPLGPIPKAWSVSPLKEFCENITDGSHHSPRSVEHGQSMASVKDMTAWGIDVSSCRRISPEDFDSLVLNGCKPQQGDILLAKDGANCLNTACEYRQHDEIVLLSSVAILRPAFPFLSAYLHTWLGLKSTKLYLREQFVSGSAIPRVVLRDLRRVSIMCPSHDVLRAFDVRVQPLRRLVMNNNRATIAMAATRDALLPKLLSGEIVVPMSKVA